MKIDVRNMKGEIVSEVELPEAIFAAPIYVDLMHQAYIHQMANARLNTHKSICAQAGNRHHFVSGDNQAG